MSEPPDANRTVDAPSLPTTSPAGDGKIAALPPTSGDRYQLADEIARGGMGVIFRAFDALLQREVAVKVLQEKFVGDADTTRRFLDEARITGQLQHPAIPPVYDLGTLPDGRPFLAMKLIKGETLDVLLRRRADPAEDRGKFLSVFEQVCQAVGYAHAHDVIHRDLKPGNVMVGAFGEVQVMDWGLAKVLDRSGSTPGGATAPDPEGTTSATVVRSQRDSDAAETKAGTILGTIAFMPPEQALGAIGKVDQRSDVFGLGAILAVILTGRPPFLAGSSETVRIHAAQGKLEDCFDRLDRCFAETELVALCKRCLSPDKPDRPADAGAVAEAVAAIREDAEERAREAELAQARTQEQRKRRVMKFSLLAAVIGLLLVTSFGAGIIVSVHSDWEEALQEKSKAQQARAAEKQARTIAELARDGEVKLRDKFERFEYGRTMEVAHQEWRDNNVAATLSLLDNTRAELRAWEWHYLHRLCHSELLTLKGHTDSVTASFSSDGSRILTASADLTTRVWDVRSGAELLTLKSPWPFHSASRPR